MVEVGWFGLQFSKVFLESNLGLKNVSEKKKTLKRLYNKNITFFSAGLHYIGQVHENSLLRVVFDQITEGQLEFQKLHQHFDTIQIGLGNEKREYTILSGKDEMKTHLIKQFPAEEEAIETFFKIMKVFIIGGLSSESSLSPNRTLFSLTLQISAKKTHYLATLKLIPQWVSLFLLKSGIADLVSPVFRLSGTCATDFVNTLTKNKDLHMVFSYFFYGGSLTDQHSHICLDLCRIKAETLLLFRAGVPPKESSVLINALLIHHYKRGAYYPKGGASEIAFHIIRTIQRHGGNCLVRAPVSQILVNENGAAYGEN